MTIPRLTVILAVRMMLSMKYSTMADSLGDLRGQATAQREQLLNGRVKPRLSGISVKLLSTTVDGRETVCMSMSEQGKKVAEKSAATARDAMKKGEMAAERSVHAAQESYSTAVDAAREFNLKIIEMLRTNTEAFFEFAELVMSTKDPGAIMQLWTSHTQQQMEAFGKQSQELAALGQKLAGASIAPISRGL